MKIQILELPMQHVDGYSHTPYAVILSEVPEEEAPSATESLQHLSDTVEDISWTLHTSYEVDL